jgi:hypothetical protein
MFIGHCDDGRGYWLLNLAIGKLVRSIHVAFVESQPAHAPAAPPVACGTSQASPPSGLEHGGAPSANLSCAGTTQIAVPTRNSFSALDDAPEDISDDAAAYDASSHHTARESSSCFVAAAYVQRLNKTARVFTQNKPPRPARHAPHSVKSEGPAAPTAESMTYPPAAHIPHPRRYRSTSSMH